MARDNYVYGNGKMGNNHQQNQMVANAARAAGVKVEKLSQEIHDRKGDWYEGDYTYNELLEIAKELAKDPRNRA